MYSKYGDQIEFVVINDLLNDDFTKSLCGVRALIHPSSLSPLAREDAKGSLKVRDHCSPPRSRACTAAHLL